ncbi:MAG: flagellar filament capping protein FliD [Lachnospiraceae bacterium]|nr:flagellar filament capping protein FliD [Lachnospiraceae bacterium]
MSAFTLNKLLKNEYADSGYPKSIRSELHKKDELIGVYKSIVKKSKDAPIYMLDKTGASQFFAVSLKEDARELKTTINSLISDYSTSVLDQKIASSSNEELVAAKYIGSSGNSDDTSFNIAVKQIATGQLNIGRTLPNDESSLEPGGYSFDLRINETDYEFQFNVSPGDTNLNIMSRIAKLIDRSNVGLKASLTADSPSESAIQIEGTHTGSPPNGKPSFIISDDNTSRKAGAVDAFGLNDMAHAASNAVFSINGTQHQSYSNIFTVNRTFELTLKKASDDEIVDIGLKADLDAMTYNINHLAGAYNDFIMKASAATNSYNGSQKIMRELHRMSLHYSKAFDSFGLNVQKDGTIVIDDEQLNKHITEDTSEDTLRPIQNFIDSLVDKSEEITIDPMQYTKQKLVCYKKPGVNFPNPYMTSMYTGMLFNSYC